MLKRVVAEEQPAPEGRERECGRRGAIVARHHGDSGSTRQHDRLVTGRRDITAQRLAVMAARRFRAEPRRASIVASANEVLLDADAIVTDSAPNQSLPSAMKSSRRMLVRTSGRKTIIASSFPGR